MNAETNLKTEKKRKFKKHYWLLVDLAVAVFVLILLLYRPGGYEPIEPGGQRGRVHPYITYLSSEIYNGAQLQEPFQLVVLDDKLTESIAGWSEGSEDVWLSSPVICFEPGRIELMAMADMKGVKLIPTVVLEPEIDENGLLNLQVDKVKIGAVNITPLARIVARRMYAQQLADTPVDMEDWRTKVFASLLNDEPFDPVFKVEDKKIRLKKITITEKNLILNFTPAP